MAVAAAVATAAFLLLIIVTFFSNEHRHDLRICLNEVHEDTLPRYSAKQITVRT